MMLQQEFETIHLVQVKQCQEAKLAELLAIITQQDVLVLLGEGLCLLLDEDYQALFASTPDIYVLETDQVFLPESQQHTIQAIDYLQWAKLTTQVQRSMTWTI